MNSRSRRLLQPPLLHRNPLEQDKPLAIEHLSPNRPKELLKRGQREQILIITKPVSKQQPP